jgi:undecaprenyl-diphosphatase
MAEACTNGVDTGFVALGYAKVAVLGGVCGRGRNPTPSSPR